MTLDLAALIVCVVTVIFYTGVSYGTLQKLRTEMKGKAEIRDVNNLGTKVNEVAHKMDDRYLALVIALMVAVPEDKELAVATLLLNAGLRR